ncbi:uncharacterized protein PV07_10507 [Cladophialophora immunda]|uniref:SET domain-containing protein n=1 Tax=Cladophialophora immunda TaxID=569365 RepID=A0A0D2AIT1_9EURO|nr:uncharacterized protein PV07_10507 [Cladophialophora immunda]KIW24817.1 hypothetical protein PV07_10507 [Cladophialophora immunda]
MSHNRSGPLLPETWETLKPDIQNWYITENETCEYIVKQLSSRNVNVTVKQIKSRLQEWCFTCKKTSHQHYIAMSVVADSCEAGNMVEFEVPKRQQRVTYSTSKIKKECDRVKKSYESKGRSLTIPSLREAETILREAKISWKPNDPKRQIQPSGHRHYSPLIVSMSTRKPNKPHEIVRLNHLDDCTAEALISFKSIKTCTYLHGLGASRQPNYTCSCKDQPCDEHTCVNRASCIECTADCPSRERCENRRFSKRQYADLSVIYQGDKGYGLRTDASLRSQQFIIEYVGEVISEEVYLRRREQYREEGNEHDYFMFLQKGEYIDAQKRGNLSRFCNHSCSPNCYVELWHVEGKVRAGIFAARDIEAGEELVFDYKTDTRGAEPQRCACRAQNCTGLIGRAKKPKRIIRLRIGRDGAENPSVRGDQGDTIGVVHDRPQSPGPRLHAEQTDIVASRQPREASIDPEDSNSDTATLNDNLTLPPLPSLPSRPDLLTVDLIKGLLASLEKAENRVITQSKQLAARRNEMDTRLRQHRRRQDEEWEATLRKRKVQDDQTQTHRQGLDAALKQFEQELDFKEGALLPKLTPLRWTLKVGVQCGRRHQGTSLRRRQSECPVHLLATRTPRAHLFGTRLASTRTIGHGNKNKGNDPASRIPHRIWRRPTVFWHSSVQGLTSSRERATFEQSSLPFCLQGSLSRWSLRQKGHFGSGHREEPLRTLRGRVNLASIVVNNAGLVVKGALLDYAEQDTVADLLNGTSPVTWHRRAKWARDIIRGVWHVHAEGYVHGDLSLDSILIDIHDCAQIADFNRGCRSGWEPPEMAGRPTSLDLGVKSDFVPAGNGAMSIGSE